MDILEALFEGFSGSAPSSCVPLAASGSNRKYYRLTGEGLSVVGVIGTDPDENRAFMALSRHFRDKGLNVPEVLASSADSMAYIQTDLGDVRLYDAISAGREAGHYSPEEERLLCRTVAMLPDFQWRGAEGLDFGICYPEPSFDSRLVMADLNYFKYCFLKTSLLEFNESRLQDDFEALCSALLACGGDCFLYRDFQARNVMLCDGVPYFIDFQGGRRGPAHYDLASFIWQARSAYPEELKEKMLCAYLDSARRHLPELDEEAFRRELDLFAIFRTLQVLGAYGFRGYVEKKSHFLESIPYAVDNLRVLLLRAGREFPYLHSLLSRLVELPRYAHPSGDGRLTVTIYSFSYRKGIPEDLSGNGGGYVFDCRSLNNPGRYEQYRSLTGMDAEVIRFIEEDAEVFSYLEHVYAVVDTHVEHYVGRGFTSLQLCFGCTGGRHRSVYCASRMAEHLVSAHKGIRVRLIHREQGFEKTWEP